MSEEWQSCLIFVGMVLALIGLLFGFQYCAGQETELGTQIEQGFRDAGVGSDE